MEDTDSKREVNGAITYIENSFKWLGFMPNEGHLAFERGGGGDHGPYIQSHRKDIYKAHVDMLIESGHAYYAFDSKEELAKMKEDLKAAGIKNAGYAGSVRERMKNSLYMSKDDSDAKIAAGEAYVIRFKMPRNEDVKFHDEVRGWVSFNTKDLDDKVIWKSSDGLPTYHMANVIDDHLMEISHVIRGEEWLSSTPLHVLMYNAFGWELPIFAHLPLILAPDGKKKLGKRDADKYGMPIFPMSWDYKDADGVDVSVSGFKDAGYEPDALLNFLALLGWNPGDNIEHMTMEEMCNSFSLDRVNKSGAAFDIKKLNSFNAHYLRNRSSTEISNLMTDMPTEFWVEMKRGDKFDMIAKMATERATFAHELKSAMSYLWDAPTLEGELKMKNVDEFHKIMLMFVGTTLENWNSDTIRIELEKSADAVDIKLGKAMPMLRLALAGGESGPQLPDIMYILGPDETYDRITSLIEKIRELA